MDTVVWPETTDRELWWRSVLGVDWDIRECADADFIEQAHTEPLDDDQYPRAPAWR